MERLSGEPVGIPVPRDEGRLHRIFRCPTCQTAVWSEYSGRTEVLFVRGGTLDDPKQVTPGVHIFTRSKLPWITLPPDVPAFEAFYPDAKTLWPPEALERRKALFGK